MMKATMLKLNDKGAVLITGLMFLLFLTIIGATALITTTNDVTISSNYKSIKESFYNSEAGVHLALTSIENGIKSGSFSLPSYGSSPADLQTTFGSTIPTGYNITLGSLENLDDINYRFTSTGGSVRGAQTTIQASFRRGSAFEYAAFGDDKLDANSVAAFYSYSSDEIIPPDVPDATDTTHHADVGSNGNVDMDWTIVDGDVKLGEKGGIDATTTYTGTQTIYGEDGELVGEVPDDPLDMRTEIPSYFSTYDATTNDNDLAIPYGLAAGDYEIEGGETLVGQSGGASYYLEDINLGNSKTLTIDASAGPVDIYLKGKIILANSASIDILNATIDHDVNIYVTEPDSGIADNQTIVDFKEGSEINMGNSPPTSFSLISDSDAHIIFHHDGDFKGVVYAPDSTVEMKNSGQVYGSVWGNVVELKNSAKVYYDTALLNKWLSKEVVLTSWAQILE